MKCPLFLVITAALVLHANTSIAAAPQRPVLRHSITNLETSWFGAPAIYDLDGDGRKELIGTYYSIYVWDTNMTLIHRMQQSARIYAPAVIADLDRDGIVEVVTGTGSRVAVYEWKNRQLSVKAGWPFDTRSGSTGIPEVRSLAAADLDHNGTIEIIAANTQTAPGKPQVFVLSANGTLYQPPGISWPAWPRYNTLAGPGGDAAGTNGPGNTGYGCYGLNVGVGNLDDDPELEIVVTSDKHEVNVFNHDGISMLLSDYYRYRITPYAGYRMNWGQMIRWFDPEVERQHYHDQTIYASPDETPWVQWTATPCNVIDLNGDGRNEVVGVPNIEFGIPYETIHYSVMVLEGSYGDGSRSGRRLPGWENLPSGGAPLAGPEVFYPPAGTTAPATVDITGDGLPEVIVSMNDGYAYAFGTNGTRLWRSNIRHGTNLMYTSEILVCDLNRDSTNELIFTTYGSPDSAAPGVPHGYLMVLDHQGVLLHDIVLPLQGRNGNGKGAPAATIGDLDGDGTLEIVVQTFDGNCFVYNVPGSSALSMPWPTARGSYLRQGRSYSTGVTTPPKILGVSLSTNTATISWTADPYTYQTLQASENPAAALPAWTTLKAFSPPSGATNRFQDSPRSNAKYYRVRAE